MDKIRFVDLVTRKIATLVLRRDSVCVGGQYYEWLGLPGKCVPTTPGSMAELYKLAIPMDTPLLTGYILPDTIRPVAYYYVLFGFDNVRVNQILYDVRLGTYGVTIEDKFYPLAERDGVVCTELLPLRLCIGVGAIVRTGDQAKVVSYAPMELYARWLKAVIKQGPPMDLLIAVRSISSIIEDYEITIAKLREQITTVYADTATMFEDIVNQYLRMQSAVRKTVEQPQQQK